MLSGSVPGRPWGVRIGSHGLVQEIVSFDKLLDLNTCLLRTIIV